MSLVGNLEDLSLGDIMQIISMSQKFGVLALESERGSGRIVFSSGLVHGACLKGVEGHFDDLRSLIVGKGILDPAGFDACESRAGDLGLSIEEMLGSETSLDIESIEELVSGAVEAAVLEMFTWPSGDFSFDVRREPEDADPQLLLKTGINSQYLAMEGMRMRDEKEHRESVQGSESERLEAAALDDLSAHEMFGVNASPNADGALFDDPDITLTEFPEAVIELVPDAAEGEACDPLVDDLLEEDQATPADLVVAAVLENAEPADGQPTQMYPRPLILIDTDVTVLEWVKYALDDKFRHVHVFQQAEQGLMRIRQYLIRGELPVVLISPDVEIDPLSGIRGLSDFVKRLKVQAEKLPVFGLIEAEEEPTAAPRAQFDGLLARPGSTRLRVSSDGEPDAMVESLWSALDGLLRA